LLTKSGLMAGLGEEPAEVERVLQDLREAGVDLVTIGQYLPPSRWNLPVASYVPPERFEAWRQYALSLGFRAAWSAPLVRSSYMAGEMGGQPSRAAC
jgi:lipoic acid synthetase